jgi:ABC-type lipoprotein release transport system permease subunit
MNDLRFAWRAVCQARWYSATVTGVLGAGIALATVVFAVVDGVLFKPLPFFRAEELFLVAALVAVALVGTLIPSWRAARVDPMQALRVE